MSYRHIRIKDIDANIVEIEITDEGAQLFAEDEEPRFHMHELRQLARGLISALLQKPFGLTLKALRRSLVATQFDLIDAKTAADAADVIPKLQGAVELIDEFGDAVGASTRRSWPRLRPKSTSPIARRRR